MTSSNTRAIQTDLDSADDAFFETEWGAHKPKPLQWFLIGLTRRTILQRGRLRHRMTNLITGMGRPIDVTFRDCKFRIEGRNNLIEYGILTRPTYNGQEIDFLSEVVKNGGVAVDIGCNIGIYSVSLGKAAGPNGRVVGIDANQEMIRHLEYNANASGLDNVTGINMAVGGSVGRVDLNIRLDDVAIVSVIDNDDGAVQMLPLLQIVQDAGLTRIDALKIDIEGHEDLALVPFLQVADEDLLPKRIVIEQCGKNQDYPGCSAEFARLGYKLMGRTKINSLYQRG